MTQRSPSVKNRLVERIKSGLRDWGRKVIQRFLGFTLAKKLYAISWSLFVVGFLTDLFLVIVLKSRDNAAAWALIPLVLALMFGAVGLARELFTVVSRLWNTTIGKFFLVIFSSLTAYIVDLINRQFLYSLTGENPESFIATRTALALLYIPFVWFVLMFLCAVALMAVSGVVLMLCILISYPFSLFGLFKERLRIIWSWLMDKVVIRSLGVGGFMLLSILAAYGYASLVTSSGPRGELIFEKVVVYTGFYPVPAGRYAALKPNSSVAFLPGDRICVAEPLPDGKFNFRTIRRDDLK